MNRLLSLPRWLLGYQGIPAMSRPTFRYELLGQLFASIGTAVVFPQFTQLFALKALSGPDWVASALVAQIAAGNFFGTFLSQYSQRRRLIPAIVFACAGMAVAFLAVALLPTGRRSILPFVGLLMIPALLRAMIINARTSIRHNNYSQSVRGSVLSRLILLHLIVVTSTVKLVSFLLDHWSGAHRLVYPMAAAAMLCSALAYSRIRVRRESQLIREASREPLHLLAGFRVLIRDRAYGLFMLFQMLSGAANLMIGPVIALWLKHTLQVTYTQGTDAMVLVPLGVAMIALRASGALFDRMGVGRFRGIGAGGYLLSRALLCLAVFFPSWPLIFVAFAFQGLGFSLNSVAWNIGHTRFATPEKSQQYMGIHLTLQGVRGLTMPFLGTGLYALAGGDPVPVFILAAVLHGVAAIGFSLLKPSKAEQAMFPPRQESFGAGRAAL